MTDETSDYRDKQMLDLMNCCQDVSDIMEERYERQGDACWIKGETRSPHYMHIKLALVEAWHKGNEND